MKKLLCYIFPFLMASILLTGCNKNNEYTTSPRANFEALWKILDENYCFFEYKNIDWDAIYNEYIEYIYEDMDEYSLFYLLGRMLDELKDGHVNLVSNFSITSYEGWYTEYPRNFEEWILWNYLERSYSIDTENIKYRKLQNQQIGYIYYGSFTEALTEAEMEKILEYLENCKGLILDVRDNGGGSITNADRLASHFFEEKTLAGYIQHKSGKGHTDFSTPYPIYITPAEKMIWKKPVVILTNRHCFSAGNNFVSKMKTSPQVTVIGDWTGGGSGLPFSSELPNGWSIRFSTSPILDTKKQHTEFGIKPDLFVEMKDEDREDGKDTLIERAISYLLQGN